MTGTQAMLESEMPILTPLQIDLCRTCLASIQAAGHGRQVETVKSHAAMAGISVQTMYRWMSALQEQTAAVRATRQRRSDAGETQASDVELRMISAALVETVRKSGQRIMTIDDALGMLRANNMIATTLSASRIGVLLRERGLHPEQLIRPEPSIEQRSLHPNHVWQVDASVCVAYYLSNATGLQVADEKAFYKNKPGNLTRIQDERLIRYTLADHFSGEILTRYYLGSESSANLTEFLLWAFAAKGSEHPMHGVPAIVQMDMGSANTSAMTLNLLERLQARVIVHERHNSRANGAVEKAHHLVERHFESALRFARVADLDDLNAKALKWAHVFGATKVHSRTRETRHASWMRISADQLRIAPPLDLMRELVTSRPVTRVVSNDLEVTFKVRGHGSLRYDVRHVPGVMAGAKLTLTVSPYRVPAVDVECIDQETGEATWMTVAPLDIGADGRRADAAVIGEELRSHARGLLDANRDAALVVAYGGTAEEAKAAKEKGALVFGGEVDPFKADADRAETLPAYMPKRGTELDAGRRQVISAPLSLVDAARRLKTKLGEHYTPEVYAWLSARFEDGVPEDQLDAIATQFTPAAPAATTTTAGDGTHGLRIVR